ncbi:DUF5989 family protein [Sphingobacterium sp. UBA6320]|uniref:DUF5989 family protein n=1 Tax=Sphingobacterium sp. UBA6320 TaxID=1947510 RepID=UPI0032E388EC
MFTLEINNVTARIKRIQNLNLIDIMEFLKDLFDYIKGRKKYWLLPMIIILLIIGLIIIVGGNSALAPFIYTIF